MRKILIGFVSLGIALGIYLLYRRVSETPRIDTDRAAEAMCLYGQAHTLMNDPQRLPT